MTLMHGSPGGIKILKLYFSTVVISFSLQNSTAYSSFLGCREREIQLNTSLPYCLF